MNKFHLKEMNAREKAPKWHFNNVNLPRQNPYFTKLSCGRATDSVASRAETFLPLCTLHVWQPFPTSAQTRTATLMCALNDLVKWSVVAPNVFFTFNCPQFLFCVDFPMFHIFYSHSVSFFRMFFLMSHQCDAAINLTPRFWHIIYKLRQQLRMIMPRRCLAILNILS